MRAAHGKEANVGIPDDEDRLPERLVELAMTVAVGGDPTAPLLVLAVTEASDVLSEIVSDLFD